MMSFLFKVLLIALPGFILSAYLKIGGIVIYVVLLLIYLIKGPKKAKIRRGL